MQARLCQTGVVVLAHCTFNAKCTASPSSQGTHIPMRTPDWAGWMAVGRGNRGRLMSPAADDEPALASAEAVHGLVAGRPLAGQSATKGCVLGCGGADNPLGEQAGDSMS